MSNKECRRKKAKNHRLPNPHIVIRHSSFVIPRRGLTLIEMLIGMAITLVMMAAVVTLFANLGAGIRVQRAAMEMSSQLRTARARLFMDLAGATCAPRPKLPSDDHDDGYLEIVEGQWSDKNPSLLLDGIDSGPTSANPELDYVISQVPSGGDPTIVLPVTGATGAVTNGRGLGDYDDILALTVRSESEPFVGRGLVFNSTTNLWEDEAVQSNLAEVVWYAVENPADGSLGEPGMRTLYRRILLIAPWISELPPYVDTVTPAKIIAQDRAYYRRSDVSFRREGNFRVPNTLADLTKRENRFAHHINGTTLFPHEVQIQNIRANPMTNASPFHPFGEPFETLLGPADPDRQGEDVMLNDVLAFDVRVYEPGSPIVTTATGDPLEPSDFGWYVPGILANILGYGSYVDLGWAPAYPPAALAANVQTVTFQGQRRAGWHPNNPGLLTGYPAIYDTWSFHYENDGIDQDDTTGNDNINDNDPITGAVDEGTDGLDTDGFNGVDDVNERETSPPYDVPLRGIQVKIRVYEPDTRQIREATVTRGLVPQ